MASVKPDSKSPAGKPWLNLVSFGVFLPMFVMGHRSSGKQVSHGLLKQMLFGMGQQQW